MPFTIKTPLDVINLEDGFYVIVVNDEMASFEPAEDNFIPEP